jgi:hypothetical protein
MCQPSRRQGFHRQILDPRAVSKLWHKEARGRGARERERREREREREREIRHKNIWESHMFLN